MPVFALAADTNEQLAQVAAHLQQIMWLMETVSPGIIASLASGTINPSSLPSLNLGRQDTSPGSDPLSIIDDATFNARWADRTCFLGNTLPFRLLARLAQRPNHFISYETLFRDVWNDEYTSPEALRSAVKVLRRKLMAAGMADLADAIDGSNSRHYALKLAGR